MAVAMIAASPVQRSPAISGGQVRADTHTERAAERIELSLRVPGQPHRRASVLDAQGIDRFHDIGDPRGSQRRRDIGRKFHRPTKRKHRQIAV